MNAQMPRAASMGLIGCPVCHLVRIESGENRMSCLRCGTTLRRRKKDSQARTWALLIAGLLLYIPANTLPIMRTVNLGGADDNTILSGVVELWIKGSPGLAFIVFTASIVVPITKFFILITLLVSAHRGSDWACMQRAKLYRLVMFIGHWSMLDVFIVALLSALVQFGIFSAVAPLPGVVFFGLTVVLTMLASMNFDPRMIWDNKANDDG